MHPFLPKLKSSNNSDRATRLAGFDERGIWRVGNTVDLSDLSNSLEIDEIDPNYLEVDSIPDMWARPLLFQMAFFNKQHLLHDRFIAEWRGLLAMLALKDIRNLPLDASEITIPKRERQDAKSPDFLQALGDLVPKHFIAEGSDWHRLYLILFNGRPIGMTSPTTLICSAVNYFNRIKHLAWFNSRLLVDPTPWLNNYEKASLISWLQNIKGNLSEIEVVSQSTGMRNDIIKELGRFQVALGWRVGDRVDPVKLSGLGLHLEHGIFSYFNQPVRVEEESPETSYVKLVPSRKDPEPSPSLLVIDKDIASQWEMKEQDVVVIGATTLGSVPFGGLGTDRTRFGVKTLRGAEWVTPDMFFTETLFYIEQPNAFPGAMEVKGQQDLSFKGDPITPVLPIQPWLLSYLTLEDLSGRFAFEKTNDGIMARLTLTLRGEDGEGKDIDIKKEYRNAENELAPLDWLPVLEIWPNFRAENWKAYYTYYSRRTVEHTFYAAPIAPGATFEKQSPYKREKYKHKLSNGDVLVDCKTPVRGSRLEKITQLDRFPEAFECFIELPNTHANKVETASAGLILLNQPNSVSQSEEWKIGIDFGTTGTNVFYSHGDKEPRALKFRDLFFRVTNSAGEDRADTITYRFVAGKEAEIPFLTFFNDFYIANPTSTILRPVLDGHIFFKSKKAQFNVHDKRMHTNLKWGQTRQDRKRANSFLTQLCLQCAAEAVNQNARSVEWRYSFPTAFSIGETMHFKQVWDNIVEKCNALLGVADSTTTPILPRAKTESVASGQFFADKKDIQTEAAFGNKGVCLDIGGSTSDISIWLGHELRWQASIRFAGRDILMNLFYQYPDFLKERFEIDKEALNDLKELKKKGDQLRFYALLDVLLKEKGISWQKNLYLSAGEPPVMGFLQLVALGLSGLIFYIGEVLGALNKDRTIKFPSEIPNVFIGGNGARMFDWLVAEGRYNIKSPIGKLFKTMMLEGTGFKNKEIAFQICTSPEPKSEVAYGLVSDDTNLEATEKISTWGVIAGEQFLEGGETQNWNEKVTPERLQKGLDSPSNLSQFQRFLETFQSYTKSPEYRDIIKPLQDYKKALVSCRQQLAHELTNAAKEIEVEDVHVEPLFIIVLKHFLNIKIGEWVKSQQPV